MAILIDENTRFLIQGITGKQGQRTCDEMLQAGSKVIAGVTPGKGGQEVDKLKEELKKIHQGNTSKEVIDAIIDKIQEEKINDEKVARPSPSEAHIN